MQVNEKDPLNLEIEENQERYIEYLKMIDNVIEWGWQISLYEQRNEIRHWALVWWYNLLCNMTEESYAQVKKYVPDLLDENGEFILTEEEKKALNYAPMARFNYIPSKEG